MIHESLIFDTFLLYTKFCLSVVVCVTCVCVVLKLLSNSIKNISNKNIDSQNIFISNIETLSKYIHLLAHNFVIYEQLHW
jgi:hypothetical protein